MTWWWHVPRAPVIAEPSQKTIGRKIGANLARPDPAKSCGRRPALRRSERRRWTWHFCRQLKSVCRNTPPPTPPPTRPRPADGIARDSDVHPVGCNEAFGPADQTLPIVLRHDLHRLSADRSASGRLASCSSSETAGRSPLPRTRPRPIPAARRPPQPPRTGSRTGQADTRRDRTTYPLAAASTASSTAQLGVANSIPGLPESLPSAASSFDVLPFTNSTETNTFGMSASVIGTSTMSCRDETVKRRWLRMPSRSTVSSAVAWSHGD